jgi:hypothetical protein
LIKETVQPIFELWIPQGTATSLPKAPTSPWMAFPMLFDAIRDKVPAKAMEVMNMHYLLFKVCNVTSFAGCPFLS